MKRKYPFLLLSLFIVFSCTKKENAQSTNIDYEHRAIPIEINSKSTSSHSGNGYLLITKSGHLANGCSGCVKVGDYYMHVDCSGAGNACNLSAGIALYNANGNFYDAITIEENELTDNDIFVMPDRSLYVGEEDNQQVWLNIPGQLSVKDSESGQFVFNDVYFSNNKVFENE
ncbi:MAG: hypothetical protein LBQ22_13005 [Bacteroidales bacterium]|jgi:hypothetical protein|nr:hypothetical protein [Bacteroidales bacterium]